MWFIIPLLIIDISFIVIFVLHIQTRRVLCRPLNTELQNKDKIIILCKVHAHIGIKENEKAVKATKKAIDMPGMTTT